jgi:hypothetical protein
MKFVFPESENYQHSLNDSYDHFAFDRNHESFHHKQSRWSMYHVFVGHPLLDMLYLKFEKKTFLIKTN